MAHLAVRTGVILTGAVLASTVLFSTPLARADAVGYLVNVSVRPGYAFPNADAALAYGYGICGKVRAARSYAQIVGDVRSDFGTTDDYQAGYLIGQAVDQLCPAMLWQLRRSAANYRPLPG